MLHSNDNAGLLVRSGQVLTSDRLAIFLYQLMRDELTPGRVEGIVQSLPNAGCETKLTNGWLAEYAEDIAKRIRDVESLSKSIEQLNMLHRSVATYKAEYPPAKGEFRSDSISSLLNAYREGDIDFTVCVNLLKTANKD